MTVDSKLYRIFKEAQKKQFKYKRDLAEHVSNLDLDEFSYQRKGKTAYLSTASITSYINMLVQLHLLTTDLKPSIFSSKTTLAGFGNTLADRASEFAANSGFSFENMQKTSKSFLDRRPVVLPTPFRIYDSLRPKCTYRMFYRIIALKCLEQNQNIKLVTKSIISFPGILDVD